MKYGKRARIVKKEICQQPKVCSIVDTVPYYNQYSTGDYGYSAEYGAGFTAGNSIIDATASYGAGVDYGYNGCNSICISAEEARNCAERPVCVNIPKKRRGIFGMLDRLLKNNL